MEIKEEQKVPLNEKTDSRILFKQDISSQNLNSQLDSNGNPIKPRFESVFDTLRIFENQNEKKQPTFKWTKKIVQKSKLKLKLSAQCPQCVLQLSQKAGFGSFEDINLISSPNNYPKNSQTRGGWLHILKIPESNLVLGDDSSQTIVLNTQILMTGKKHYFIYLKGKIYRFDNENSENSTKVLNIKNCNMDMITIQRPDQTVAQSVSCNLEQGIQVRSLNKSYLLLSATKGDNFSKRKDIQDWFDFLKKYGILLNMKSYYEIGQLLGKGNFAKVYEATNFKTKEKFALKTIEKKMISKNRRNFVYESENNIHLILEYLNGGELFERIKKNGSYNEKDASVIMRCILDALVAMHEKQIVHRDLKPENLLFKLTGKFVFSGKNYREILLKNKECLVPFPPQYWTNLTSEAKDLVKKMLEKDANNRLTAAKALEHPWFKLNGINLQNLQLNFQEVDELVLTDDVNLQLITTSPIWNKTRMRDEIRKVNAEQDKMNTFQTPLPQPKFFGSKKLYENAGKQKVIGGVVLQNLYNNQNYNTSKQDNNIQTQKKQYQTPIIRPESSKQPAKAQNSTLNMLQQLFRPQSKVEEQKVEQDKDEVESENIKEESKQVVPNLLNVSNYSQKSMLNPSYNNQPTNNSNLNVTQNVMMKSQDITQTSTPNQQNSSFQQPGKIDPQIEMIFKKWLEPNCFALSLINEDFHEDAKSLNQFFGSQVNSNDPNFQQMRNQAVLAFRQYTLEQEQVKALRFDNQKGIQLNTSQSMHFQQIHDFLMKDILPDENQQIQSSLHNDQPPQPYYPFNALKQPLLAPQQNQIYGRQSPNINKGLLPIVVEEENDEQKKKKKQYLEKLSQVKKENQKNEEDDESLGELEIEENASGLIDQNKIVDFNAHSNNVLMKSSTCNVNDQRLSGALHGFSNLQKSSPNKIDLDQQNINNMRPANPSSISVNSNSCFMNSKQSNYQINNSDSSGNKSQNQFDLSVQNIIPQSHQQQLSQKHLQIKNQRKSQFCNSSNSAQADATDNINEEANVEGHIDTEEQVINNFFHVPTTPGSIYGGSRNIMKHSLNYTPFNKYLEQPRLNKPPILNNNSLLQQSNITVNNIMHQSSKSSQNQNGSRPSELQQNITFNNSQYFNKEVHTKSDVSNKKFQHLNTNQLLYDEEIKEDYSPLNKQEIDLFGSDNARNKKSKNSQLLGLIKQEMKDQSCRSDELKQGVNQTPDGEISLNYQSNFSSNEGLQKQINQINQNQQIQSSQKQKLIGNDPQYQLYLLQNSINPQDSVVHYENFRRSLANASQNCDDKSQAEFHTAFQSLAEIQNLNHHHNISNHNNSSWQNQHSANENFNKSLSDMNNKGSQGMIYTEQNINEQQRQGGGSNEFGISNLSQEALKHQNSYNLGDGKNNRLNQVNNARKKLINNI
ncbi:protein kinase domain containing protein [Stylonychia lemnae]|uniref:Protein kinase domain containing protein n=1 Tax=Stylonychia lemnae TaxID=5949 RepID=A0A078AS88_STYLE|nr:protein kinase domain containing protein [Stylonychia lemnae]|eukprot:CDW84831.1 protein kinase domain containing protein [Stylonychia lemnae]